MILHFRAARVRGWVGGGSGRTPFPDRASVPLGPRGIRPRSRPASRGGPAVEDPNGWAEGALCGRDVVPGDRRARAPVGEAREAPRRGGGVGPRDPPRTRI